MKKTLLSRTLMGLASLAVLSASASFSVFADNSTPEDTSDSSTFTDGILTYNIIEDTRFVEITACDASATNVNVMAEMDGYTISSIADGAFAGCTKMQSITLPQNGDLTTIGAYAFAECTALKKVTLPNTLTEIPVGMFAYCTSLEEVTFGDKITAIGDEAFRECTALKEITLPESVTTMGGYVFRMCSALENVTLSESLTSMGAYSFMGCTSLTSFHIPMALEDAGDAPFLACMNLTDITVDENNPSYTVKDGLLFSKDETVLYFYPPSRPDTSFTVPEGVIDIYDGAFFQCTNLESVTLPSTLLAIGSSAFDYCVSLKSVTIPQSVVHIMNAAFADCYSLESVIFEGAENEDGGEGEDLAIEAQAFYVCESLSEVVLPKRVSGIGEYAFGVTEITDASGNPVSTAIDGFALYGYDAAEKYAKSCDLKIGFSPRSFPWKTVVFWVVSAGVLIAIVFFAVRIVKKNMMTPEEKEALRQAKAEMKAESPEDTPADNDYKSILGDDDSEEEKKPHEETEEEKAEREAEELRRFRGTSQGLTHFRGHDEN